MEYVTLPNTDLRVSRVCLGTWQFSGSAGKEDVTWGAADEAEAEATLHAALAAGITFFDCAEAYGNNHAEKVLGKAVASSSVPRSSLVIASKFGKHKGAEIVEYGASDVREALDKSLKALQMEYVDLYQVHWRGNVRDVPEVLEALREAKQEGRVRHFSVCNYGPQDVQEWVEAGGCCVANQVAYNLLWRAVEFAIAPACAAAGMGLLCYSPLQQGLLSGKYTEASQVPEGRRRTRHFAADSTSLSRHGEEGAEKETFAAIAALRDIADSLLDEHLTGEEREAALQQKLVALAKAWLLAQPSVSCILVGARSPQQATAAAQVERFDASVLARCTDATEALKAALGPNADMWAAQSRIH